MAGPVLDFSPYRLDLGDRRLWRGGSPVKLRPKAFVLLEALTRRAGSLVSTEELFDAAWPETAVSEGVLKVAIRELRVALGDDASNPRYIETVPRLGYRFVAPVRGRGLPRRLTSFVGRERQLGELLERATRAPLLTLCGPAGSGKTRLAHRLGEQLVEREREVVWVDLQEVHDSESVATAVAIALGVRQPASGAIARAIVDDLSDRRLHVVLDNCEQVADAVATLLGQLLGPCPNLGVIATSRTPVRVEGELVWQVPPLERPAEDASDAELAGCESVRLFLDRAGAVLPERGAQSLARVAAICRRLDGLPLAIELAAARLRVLSLEQLERRLDRALGVLGEGPALPSRQRTMSEAIAWSWELLASEERDLLARLSVFPGAATLEAIEEVCAPFEHTLDVLARLVDHSMVQRVADSPPRFALLEVVRQFAGERREASRAEDDRESLASYALSLVERLAPQLPDSGRGEALATLSSELPSLKQAFSWLLEKRRATEAAQLAGGLFWFWFFEGRTQEGFGWSRRALELLPEGATGSAWASLHFSAGVFAWVQGDSTLGERLLEKSMALFAMTGQPSVAGAHALHFYALVASAAGGNREDCLARAGDAVAAFSSLEDSFGLAVSLVSRGVIQLGLGRAEQALADFEQSSAIARRAGDPYSLALALRNQGIAHQRCGRGEAAVPPLRESLRLLRTSRDRWFVSRGLEALGEALAAVGDAEQAARLMGASERQREVQRTAVLPQFSNDYQSAQVRLEHRLGPERLEELWREGRGLDLEAAITVGLGEDQRDIAS